MIRIAHATAVGVVLAAVSTALAPPALAAEGSLAGTWASVDTDGSNQTLSITGSGRRVYSMVYFDESASSACAGAPARVAGPGFVDGDSVYLVGTLVCLPGGNPFRERLTISFDYDAGTDTLTDGFGITWERTG